MELLPLLFYSLLLEAVLKPYVNRVESLWVYILHLTFFPLLFQLLTPHGPDSSAFRMTLCSPPPLIKVNEDRGREQLSFSSRIWEQAKQAGEGFSQLPGSWGF